MTEPSADLIAYKKHLTQQRKEINKRYYAKKQASKKVYKDLKTLITALSIEDATKLFNKLSNKPNNNDELTSKKNKLIEVIKIMSEDDFNDLDEYMNKDFYDNAELEHREKLREKRAKLLTKRKKQKEEKQKLEEEEQEKQAIKERVDKFIEDFKAKQKQRSEKREEYKKTLDNKPLFKLKEEESALYNDYTSNNYNMIYNTFHITVIQPLKNKLDVNSVDLEFLFGNTTKPANDNEEKATLIELICILKFTDMEEMCYTDKSKISEQLKILQMNKEEYAKYSAEKQKKLDKMMEKTKTQSDQLKKSLELMDKQNINFEENMKQIQHKNDLEKQCRNSCRSNEDFEKLDGIKTVEGYEQFLKDMEDKRQKEEEERQKLREQEEQEEEEESEYSSEEEY